MTPLESALVESVTALEELDVPYMLIGGLAVAEWGEPRATLDVDLTVWVEASRRKLIVTSLAARFTSRVQSPEEFVNTTHTLPMITNAGVPVDFVFASFPIEQDAIQAAVPHKTAGIQVRVAPLAYLLFMKLTSDRDKDLRDAAALLRRRSSEVDYTWLE